jgi:hypothetical protein
MKKNKYLIFASIGFELVALIVFFIYLGEYLVDKQGWPQSTKAFGIVLAFGIWITSLFVKLKSLEKSKDSKND